MNKKEAFFRYLMFKLGSNLSSITDTDSVLCDSVAFATQKKFSNISASDAIKYMQELSATQSDDLVKKAVQKIGMSTIQEIDFLHKSHALKVEKSLQNIEEHFSNLNSLNFDPDSVETDLASTQEALAKISQDMTDFAEFEQLTTSPALAEQESSQHSLQGLTIPQLSDDIMQQNGSQSLLQMSQSTDVSLLSQNFEMQQKTFMEKLMTKMSKVAQEFTQLSQKDEEMQLLRESLAQQANVLFEKEKILHYGAQKKDNPHIMSLMNDLDLKLKQVQTQSLHLVDLRSSFSHQHSQLIARTRHLQQQITLLEQKKTETESTLNLLSEQKDTQSNEVSQLSKTILSLKKDIQVQKNLLQQIREQYNHEKSEYSNRVSALKEKENQLERSVVQLDSAKTQLNLFHKQLLSRQTKLQQDFDLKQSELDRQVKEKEFKLQETFMQQKKLLDQLHENVSAREEILKQKEQVVQSLSVELEKKHAQTHAAQLNAQARAQALEQSSMRNVVALEEKKKRLQYQIEQLERQLEMKQEQVHSFDTQNQFTEQQDTSAYNDETDAPSFEQTKSFDMPKKSARGDSINLSLSESDVDASIMEKLNTMDIDGQTNSKAQPFSSKKTNNINVFGSNSANAAHDRSRTNSTKSQNNYNIKQNILNESNSEDFENQSLRMLITMLEVADAEILIDPNKAKTTYKKIRELYEELSTEQKVGVRDRILKLYKQIQT